MMTSPPPDVTELIRRNALTLLAAAHNGLTYATDPFDRYRYGQVRSCAEELMDLISDGEMGQLQAVVALESGHMTPKVSVRAALFNAAEQILLVQERADGLWTLPGGWCEIHESPGQAVAKEVREEAGVVVEVEKLVAVVDQDKQAPRPAPAPLFHVYKLFFLCRERERVPPDLTETSAIDWFDMGALPALSMSVTESQLKLMHTHWLNPHLATVFD